MALSTQEYVTIVSVLYTKYIAEYTIRSEGANEITLRLFEFGSKVPLVKEFQIVKFLGLRVS
jgi:hypothetical protein